MHILANPVFGKKSKPFRWSASSDLDSKNHYFCHFLFASSDNTIPLLLLEIQLAVAIMKALPLLISRVMMVFLIVSLLYILVPHKNWSYKGKDQRGRKKRIVYSVCVKWGYFGWKEQKPSKMNFRQRFLHKKTQWSIPRTGMLMCFRKGRIQESERLLRPWLFFLFLTLYRFIVWSYLHDGIRSQANSSQAL